MSAVDRGKWEALEGSCPGLCLPYMAPGRHTLVGQCRRCWPLQKLLAIAGGVGHCRSCWLFEKVLVIAAGVGHCSRRWPFKKLLAIAEADSHCRRCWPLQKLLAIQEGVGHCRRYWSLPLQLGDAGGWPADTRGCGIPALRCSTSTEVLHEPSTITALSPVGKRRARAGAGWS